MFFSIDFYFYAGWFSGKEFILITRNVNTSDWIVDVYFSNIHHLFFFFTIILKLSIFICGWSKNYLDNRNICFWNIELNEKLLFISFQVLSFLFMFTLHNLIDLIIFKYSDKLYLFGLVFMCVKKSCLCYLQLHVNRCIVVNKLCNTIQCSNFF